MHPLILRLDHSGKAIGWINWQGAVTLYSKEMVAWTLGENRFRIHGGINRLSGEHSWMEIDSIIATRGIANGNKFAVIPPLTNRELFHRDQHMCMYCVEIFSDGKLTRDHVIPISQDGADMWTNVITACVKCNQRKGCRTPEQAHMKLHAIPYAPNFAEWLVLRNRRILSDQMDFLKSQFSKKQGAPGMQRAQRIKRLLN